MKFPNDFLWGASTSSAQIEGAWNEDGKTPSIWDDAPREKIKHGEDCHVACDHYHRFKEDVAMMKEMGLNSYRFSISWPRVIDENNQVNPQGLRFYSSLVDELKRAGIEPIVTLYHWDMPRWVQDLGGWESKRITPYFLHFAETVVDALSDRVKYWITFNEPSCFLMNGYMQGAHAPFKRHYLSLRKFTRVFMETNAKTVAMIRARAVLPPLIGLSFAASAFLPKKEDDSESIEQARRKTFYRGMGTMNNRWWMDPILLGRPATAYGVYRNCGKKVKSFRCDFDFLGVNHYEAFDYALWGGDKHADRTGKRRNSLGWILDERSLYWTMRFLYERYRLPILVTENGIALDDRANEASGEIEDVERCLSLDRFLAAVARACEEGVPVIGYEHWSLLDNFEWAEGYGPRFGLIYVDFATGERKWKRSAWHYRDLIAKKGETQ